MEIKEKLPNSLGWLEIHLDKKHINHLWDCIETARGESAKSTLVGQIEKSYQIFDKDDIFLKEVILRCIDEYGNAFGHSWTRSSMDNKGLYLKPYLQNMWVNYQNAGEYQPIHDHGGMYSFAIWLTNPVEYIHQTNKKNAQGASASFNNSFCFQYVNMLGQQQTTMYPMGKELEGKMVFFPAYLNHCVYPFYDCDEQRVSVSGNIMLKDKTSDLTPV